MLQTIQADSRYQANLSWGEPRPGHPEGSLANHIAELETNLAELAPRLTPEQVERLRVVIHVHDTFKPQARDVAITHPHSHASLARTFLAEFTQDPDLLAVVQFHDEPFALWRRRDLPPSKRWTNLLQQVKDWDLFLCFLIIDGCTAGKSREPLRWFLRELPLQVRTKVDRDWILPDAT